MFKNNKIITVYSPMDGEMKDLKKVKDEVFSSEMVGKGIALIPTSELVGSPVKGKIVVAFPTGHAFGIETKRGPQILLHIGLDTVELNGTGFEIITNVNQNVKVGDDIVKVDLKTIKDKKPTDTVVLVTNETLGNYKISDVASGKIKKGEILFKLIPS